MHLLKVAEPLQDGEPNESDYDSAGSDSEHSGRDPESQVCLYCFVCNFLKHSSHFILIISHIYRLKYIYSYSVITIFHSSLELLIYYKIYDFPINLFITTIIYNVIITLVIKTLISNKKTLKICLESEIKKYIWFLYVI